MLRNKSKSQVTYAELMTYSLLTVEEAAIIIRISRRQFFRMLTGGVIAYIKVGKRTLINRESLLKTVFQAEINPQCTLFGDPVKYAARECRERQSTCSMKEEPQSRRVEIEESSQDSQSGNRRKISKNMDTRPLKRTIAPEGVTHETHYTLKEVCSKFGYRYGAIYGIRNRYNVPSVHAWGTTCFPKVEMDAAVASHKESLGKDPKNLWISVLDLKAEYGLEGTQIRRFAEQYQVRTKKVQNGHVLMFFKPDWETARKLSESKSMNTKKKRS